MASWPEFRPTELLRRLVDGDVDFVLIGGLAVVAHGYPRLTRDVDICYSTVPANLDALARVLIEIHARLRGIEDDLPFAPDVRTLRSAQLLTLTTDAGELDLLAEPAGAPGYTTLRRRAERVEVAGVRVLIASVEDLLAMKKALGRPQDLLDAEALEVVIRRRQ